MRKSFLKRILILLVLILMLTGCSKISPKEKNELAPTPTLTPSPIPSIIPNEITNVDPTPKPEFFDEVRIDASLATQPLTNAILEKFTDINIIADYTNTHPAYIKLINGETDLIVVTEPSEEELNLANLAEVELEITPVVKEAFVFYVNKENPVNSLTTEQVQKIYAGEITNWEKVGGNNSEIIAYQRPVNSGSQTGMLSLVMKDYELMEAPKETLIDTMFDIVNMVSSYNNGINSIGYSYLYYAKTMYQDMDKKVVDNIKFLKINDIEPDNKNISEEKYPYTTAYYIVTRADEPANSPAKILKSRLLSEEGQKIAEEVGYVPLSVNENIVDNSNVLDDPNLKYLINSYREQYYLNPLEIREYTDIDGTLIEGIDFSQEPETYCVNFIQIEGLTDKNIEDKINREIKEAAYSLLTGTNPEYMDYESVHSYIDGNFSNILSIVLINDDTYETLNFDLRNGNKIQFSDLFIKSTALNQIITDSVYRTLAYSDYDFNDYEQELWEQAFNMDFRDTSNYEEIFIKVIQKIDNGNLKFSISPTNIYIYDIIDKELTKTGYDMTIQIKINQILDNTTMFKKFLKSENIFEKEPNSWNIVGTYPFYYNEILKYEIQDNVMVEETIFYFDEDCLDIKDIILKQLSQISEDKLTETLLNNPHSGVFYSVGYTVYYMYEGYVHVYLDTSITTCQLDYFTEKAFKDYIEMKNINNMVESTMFSENLSNLFPNLEIHTESIEYKFDLDGNMIL